MRRTTYTTLLLLAVLGCETRRPVKEDPRLLYDRVWVDRLPEKHTDYMQALFVLGARPVGVFQKASSYDLHLEFFFYTREGEGHLKYRFPQSEKQGAVRYQVRACHDQ